MQASRFYEDITERRTIIPQEYNIGDIVRVVKINTVFEDKDKQAEYNAHALGKTGTITKVMAGVSGYMYMITGDLFSALFDEEELEHYEG